MQAGRELDALVAEKVMGYLERVVVRKGRSLKTAEGPRIAFRHSPDRFDLGEYSRHWTEDGTKIYCGSPFSIHFAPRYSVEIAAAWRVVEKIRKSVPKQTATQTFSFQLCQTGTPGGWHCSFVVNDGDWSTQAYVDEIATAPLAICLAALKAVGVEVPSAHE